MPGTFQPIQVGISPQRIQTWLAPNEAFLLVNTDITNQIFIGNDPSNQAIPIPPLGSLALSQSKHDIWLSTGGIAVKVQALLLPSGTQWTPSPAQVAAQINALGLAKDTTLQTTNVNTAATNSSVGGVNFTLGAATNPAIQQLGGGAGISVAQNMLNGSAGVTREIAALMATGLPGGAPGGVPLLRDTNQLAVQATEVTILAGHVQTVIAGSIINQPSYEMALTLRFPTNAGTVPFGEVLIEWFDAATGIALDIVAYELSGGNNQQIFFNINGPNRGNEIAISLTNLDSVQSMFATWVVNATSHVHDRDRLLQPSYQSSAPNGFQNPAGDPTSGLIANAQPVIPSAASTNRLIAAYNGQVNLMIDNGGQTNDVVVSIVDPGTLYSSNANAEFFVNRIGAGLRSQVTLSMPHGNTQMIITNTNSVSATSITPKISVTRKDY